MSILISNNVEKEFVITTLKDCYLSYLREVLFSNKFNKEAVALMNDYLTKNYNIDFNILFNLITNNLHVTTQGDNYKLSVNEEVIVNRNYRLGMLMRLVDYGNSEIKGLHLFNKVEKYIQRRLHAIFTIHSLIGD